MYSVRSPEQAATSLRASLSPSAHLRDGRRDVQAHDAGWSALRRPLDRGADLADRGRGEVRASH